MKNCFFGALTVLFLCTLILLNPMAASAQTETDSTAITVEENGLTYSVQSDGATVVSYSGSKSNLSIPASIDGVPVTAVGNAAFRGCSVLTDITLPSGITYIGHKAFADCPNLKNVLFLGDFPEFYCNVFRLECNDWECEGQYCGGHDWNYYYTSFADNAHKITIRYPAGNETWNNIPFGVGVCWEGNVVWTSVCESFKYEIQNRKVTITDYTGNENDLVIPEYIGSYPVTSIGANAFEYGTFSSITIPSGVTDIGSNAFYKCTALTKVFIPSMEDWLEITFADMVANPLYNAPTSTNPATVLYVNESPVYYAVIPDGTTAIGEYAFSGYSSMKSVTIPESVKEIGEYAFAACTSLYSMTIPESVTSIADGILTYCESLKYVIFSHDIVRIGDSAFSNCPNLDSVSIMNNVTYIGNNAFRNCEKLDTLVFLGDAPTIRSSSFENVELTAYYPFDNPTWTENVLQNHGGAITWKDHLNGIVYELLDGTAQIVNYYGNTESLVIPATIKGYPVTAIQSKAFYCSMLEMISLPNSITYIGDYAFSWSSLTEITIPASVVELGNEVFYHCTDLKEIYFLGDCFVDNNMVADLPIGCMCDEFYCRECNGEYGSLSLINPSVKIYIPINNTTWDNYITRHSLYWKMYFPGPEIQLENGLRYTIVDEEAFITAYYGTENQLVIPTYLEGYPVTHIAPKAILLRVKEIILPDTLKHIGVDAFYYTQATVYYPSDNGVWDESMRKNYGGTITWQAYSTPRFTGASIALKEDLTLRFSLKRDEIEMKLYEDCYAVLEINSETYRIDEFSEENGKYIIPCEHISPRKIGDKVSVTVYAVSNGTERRLTDASYSVADYCYSMLSKTEDQKLCKVLVDLLNYCAAAQKYANYNTSELCNSALTEEQKSWGTAENYNFSSVLNMKYITVENPKVKWLGGGLVLENAVTMRFRLKVESIDGLSIKITADGNEWIITDFEPVPGKAGQYYVYFRGLAARQMRENIYISVYEGNTCVSNTVRYSVESYAYSKQNDADIHLAELVKAMMRYGISAENYLE